MKLSRAGFRVETVGDGLAAWHAISRESPDLLITDFQMPRMNGLELCRQVRSNPATSQLPVLMLTAKGFEMDESTVRAELGVIKILAKPFSPRDLLQIVEETLAAVVV